MAKSYRIGSCELVFTVGDITRAAVDAIANAANSRLGGGSGVDGAIHRAAGPELLEACFAVRATLPGQRLETGGAVATPGFRLRAKHVIHCVGPVYDDAPAEAPRLLASCFTRALAICREIGASSVAFPAISTGIYGYPLAEAASVTVRAILADLAEHGAPARVRMVLFDQRAYESFVQAADEATGAEPSS